MKSSDAIRDRLGGLKRERGNWETRFQSISDNQLARADFTDITRNLAPRDSKIYDGTAMDAWFMLTNAIQSILANVESNWIYLDTFDKEDLEDDEVIWLEEARGDLLNAFRDATAKFPTQFNETVGDVTGYGTGGIHTKWSFQKKSLIFSSRPLPELFIDNDESGTVDSIYRRFMLSPRNSLQAFPEMPDDVRRIVTKADSDDQLEWITTFEPDDENPNKVQSQTILVEEGSIVAEDKLHELPIHIGRWRTDAGQTYGTGPGVLADPFARTLNLVVKDWLIQSQKSVRPPLMVADDGVLTTPSTMPGTITKISAYTPGNLDPVRPMDVGGNFRVANEEIFRLQESIRRAYLHEILQITDSKELTAFHVQELTNRSQQWVAPVFQRLKVELVQPMVDRCLRLMIQAKAIRRPPPSLIEKGVRVVYISPAQRANEMRETEASMRSVERVVALSQVYPEVLDNFNPDEIARQGHMGFSADPKLLRPEKEVKEIRDQRAAQQQLAAEQDAAQKQGAVQLAMSGQTDAAKILTDQRRGG